MTGRLSAIVMRGLALSMVNAGNINSNNLHFSILAQEKCQFLNDRFIRMLYINVKDQIFYALCHTHMRINGQLYQNGLLIGNLRNGNQIQKGYCSLKNIDFSPNFRYILDVPYDYQNYGETLYHIRLLLSKSSLYMMMIQKNQLLTSFSDVFKQNIVGLL